MSKLTIIIPLLRKPKHLKQCLDSIAEQNLHNIDVLLVLDARMKHLEESFDELAQKYKTSFKIRHIVCDDGYGISAVRNYGLMNCTGEYVYFMEEEDYLAPATLQQLLDAVPNLPVSMVYSRVKPKERLLSGIHEEYEEEVQFLFETDENKLSKRPVMDQVAATYERPAIEYMAELRNNLEDYTVLGCMFHRNFLKDNDIWFCNDVHIYPDALFICQVLINATETKRVEEGAYIRRSGTFHYAEEKYYDEQDQLTDYMKCYDQTYSYCISNLAVMLIVQETMCSRYVNVAVRQICKSKDRDWQQGIYDVFANQMKRIDKRVIASFSKADRKHLTLLLNGNLQASISYMSRFIKIKKREHLFKKKSYFLRAVAERLFGDMDILERYIVFESGHGHRYYGDPKYIYQYLQENFPGEYKCIWVVNDSELAKRIDGKAIKVKRLSLRYYYYILRAKYWVNDTRQPIWWYKSKEQKYICTWLGTPMQKLFLDNPAFEQSSALVKRGVKAQVQQWDYLLSANSYTTKHYQSAFGIEKEKILEIGNPRNDILTAPNAEERKKKLMEEMGLPKDKKTILYAPVWREEEATDIEGYYKLQLGLHRMKEQMEKDYIVLIRIHDYITGKIILDKALEGFVYDFSFYDDVQELLLISDFMITDYSSMVFDYAYLKRPIFFYLYDLNLLESQKNHFYFDFETEQLPGPLCHTTQEIIDHIKNIDKVKEEYKQPYENFVNCFCNKKDDKSAERLCRTVFEEMSDLYEYMDEESKNEESKISDLKANKKEKEREEKKKQKKREVKKDVQEKDTTKENA